VLVQLTDQDVTLAPSERVVVPLVTLAAALALSERVVALDVTPVRSVRVDALLVTVRVAALPATLVTVRPVKGVALLVTVRVRFPDPALTPALVAPASTLVRGALLVVPTPLSQAASNPLVSGLPPSMHPPLPSHPPPRRLRLPFPQGSSTSRIWMPVTSMTNWMFGISLMRSSRPGVSKTGSTSSSTVANTPRRPRLPLPRRRLRRLRLTQHAASMMNSTIS